MTAPNNLSHLTRDRGYRFIDRDPILDEITRLISKSGLSTVEICDLVYKASHSTYRPSPTTLSNWQSGTTRRPQNFTITWVAHVLGYRRAFIRIKGAKS